MSDTPLLEHLKSACAWEWERYIRHDFVRQLGTGDLPEPAFRHYLQQDYLFLLHFARAYALAGYKAHTLEDMRTAAATFSALVDTEMKLHVRFCTGWGLTEAEMEALPEDGPTVAYTRFVLDRGMAGDLLDLHVALAPCVVGYAEIGRWLEADPSTLRDGNPYAEWIAMYAGNEYQAVSADAIANLDSLFARRGGAGRMDSLIRTFRMATELEGAFWQMGLDRA